jgi:hypothetical protein
LIRAAGIAAACLLMSAFVIAGGFGGPAAAVAKAPAPQPSPSPSSSASAPSPVPNPFPSSSAAESPSPGINGYVAALIDLPSGSGGTYVPAGSTAPPIAFPAGGGRGFTIDVAGKLSHSFAASLRLQDDSFHAGDRPVITTTEGAILYDPYGAREALGLGIISFQRYNGVSSATGGGVGGMFLPDTTHHVSAFGKLFFYPSLSFPQIGATLPATKAQHGSLFTYQLGVAVAPNGGGGLFYSIGLGGHAGAPSAYSPQSVTALQIGIGSTF